MPGCCFCKLLKGLCQCVNLHFSVFKSLCSGQHSDIDKVKNRAKTACYQNQCAWAAHVFPADYAKEDCWCYCAQPFTDRYCQTLSFAVAATYKHCDKEHGHEKVLKKSSILTADVESEFA